jgi:hypothetical protein
VVSGRIAKILSDTEVILNVGATAGVQEGMEFVIFSEGEHVLDPETGEDLGSIETVKGRLHVDHVMENIARASTMSYSVTLASWYDQMARASGVFETRRSKLKVDEGQITPIDEDRLVKVGDRVRSIPKKNP